MEYSSIDCPEASAVASVMPAPRRTRVALTPRPDVFAFVHKALRLATTDALTRVGRLDSNDDGDVRAAALSVRELVELGRVHLASEERHVRPVLEAALPGASGRTARDHDDQLRAFDRLEADVRAVERATGPRASVAAHRLYRDLALFAAESFVHMHGEEVDDNAVLWGALDDGELAALERRLLAADDPAQQALLLRWLAPALTPAERAAFFARVRAKLTPPAYAVVMSDVLAQLDRGAKRKLLHALSG